MEPRHRNPPRPRNEPGFGFPNSLRIRSKTRAEANVGVVQDRLRRFAPVERGEVIGAALFEFAAGSAFGGSCNRNLQLVQHVASIYAGAISRVATLAASPIAVVKEHIPASGALPASDRT